MVTSASYSPVPLPIAVTLLFIIASATSAGIVGSAELSLMAPIFSGCPMAVRPDLNSAHAQLLEIKAEFP